MTLDEAIKHCEEKAEELREQAGFDTDNERYRMSESEKSGCLKCAKEHEQLAEWLKDYKRLLEERLQGEWKNVGFMVCECNNCKNQFHELEANNYCPNCGAEMTNIK